MKRKRDQAEMVPSEIRAAIDELLLLAADGKSSGGAAVADGGDGGCDQKTTVRHYLPLKPFLALCNLLVQVLDKIGPTMVVLRQDIHSNIERLEKFHDCDPSIYSDVVEILKKEANEGKAKKGASCSKAFVWLTRSLDFTLILLQLLVKDFGRNLEQAVEESYNVALKPWHGWISSAAYKWLSSLPDKNNFVKILKSENEDDAKLKEEMRRLVSLLAPVSEQNREVMVSSNQNCFVFIKSPIFAESLWTGQDEMHLMMDIKNLRYNEKCDFTNSLLLV
ncbi:Glycolipid transfer protein 3 [Striga hermonthica]|uniref:Glycolipid transfer protein 3 n=1 Tax=Striga hermonthica TaxID=68872 RepID=A0A9N7NJ33_STRHE|nr:Glycolipid transfer protein 3 [Striga hermonthica]